METFPSIDRQVAFNRHSKEKTRFKKILDREFYNFKHFLYLINILNFIGDQFFNAFKCF